jgi:hypothetical protein
MTQRNMKIPCSEQSLNAREDIFATAPRVDVWFLLEYRGAWTDKAFLDSKIPEDVKERININLETIPNARLQLIKRGSNSGDTLKFYIAKSDELEPKLFEFDFRSYEEILGLDINKILKGNYNLREEPLFLVCTNGAYDRCCGKYGAPVYLEAVKNEMDFMVWQTTHLGGHRFAANVLHLPYGIYYGRVTHLGVHKLIEDSRNCGIDLEHYRGRSCYNKDVQAAEYFLRTKTGIKEISGFRFISLKNLEKENSVIEFISQSDEETHHVHINKDKEAFMNYTSCKDHEKSPVVQYRSVDYKVL